jgi:hypothetical protein
MMHYNELAPVPSDRPVAHADRLRLAVAGYLARFKGASLDHTHSDLRCYLAWCSQAGMAPYQTHSRAADGAVFPCIRRRSAAD